MRQIVLVLTLVLFGSAPVWAGGSNPDQLNVDSTFYSTSPDGAADNTAQITNSGNENDADGEVHNHAGSSPNSSGATIFWEIWSPDKVSRSLNKANQSQKSYVEVGFTTWDEGGTSWDSTTFEKCTASTKVKGSEGSPETAKWKVKCKGLDAATLGISVPQAIRIGALLSDYIDIEKGKISIKGSGPVD